MVRVGLLLHCIERLHPALHVSIVQDGFAAHTDGNLRLALCIASSITPTSSCVLPSTRKPFGKNWGWYGEPGLRRESEELPSVQFMGPARRAARPKKRDPVARGLMSNSVRQSDVRRLHKHTIVPQHGRLMPNR